MIAHHIRNEAPVRACLQGRGSAADREAVANLRDEFATCDQTQTGNTGDYSAHCGLQTPTAVAVFQRAGLWDKPAKRDAHGNPFFTAAQWGAALQSLIVPTKPTATPPAPSPAPAKPSAPRKTWRDAIGMATPAKPATPTTPREKLLAIIRRQLAKT